MTLLIPAYWINYGPSNFLWISDVTLILAFLAVLFENHLFGSMAAIGGLFLESFWTLSFGLLLFFDYHFAGVADYMFDQEIALWLRALSLFHVPLPFLFIWLVKRLGYVKKAVILQTLLTWGILIFSYFFTKPSKNINWVFNFNGITFTSYPFVVALIITFVYLATHFLLVAITQNSGS
ncbi:MAG: hypothetical protein JJU12_00895 [Chlamydiales bacterium]|nr:hypothetical protein [Chlamydiales bacterium]